MPTQGLMFRKGKKMRSKILPSTELNIHILLFLQLCHANDWKEHGNLIIKGGFDESKPCSLLYEIASPLRGSQ